MGTETVLIQIFNDAGFKHYTVVCKDDALQLMVTYGEHLQEMHNLQIKALTMDLETIKDRLKSHSEYIEGFAKKVLRESDDIKNTITLLNQ